MAKILEGLFESMGPTQKEVQSILRKKKEKTICYVLITCTQPSDTGEMEVELKFEGEKWLAAYLIRDAQGILEES